jgi:hypothetical protein
MANRNTQLPASPAVTFSPEQLQAVIAQAIAEHEAAKTQKVKAGNRAGRGNLDRTISGVSA